MRNRSLLATVGGFLSLFTSMALPATAQNRLPQAIPANSAHVAVPNTVSPKLKTAIDLGVASPGTALTSLSLRFNMTPAQTVALDQLLAAQQNPSSPLYHQWLTPEQFGAEFGLSPADIATASNWLQAQGFTVTGVARGRTFINFSGSVGQVNQAFGVALHNVKIDGEQHISNLTDPVLPAPLANVVLNVTGLNDLRLKPRIIARKVPAKPSFNGGTTGNDYGNLIAPGDFYTIYDIKPLHNAATPINGSGITIAVMGQVDLYASDITAFRSASGLSTTNLPVTKTYGTDPGQPTALSCNLTNPPNSCSDLQESSLDVEWAGAVAPSASILFVNGPDVFDNAMTGAIDNNVAPILTVSYGDCEVGFTAAGISQFNGLFKQANAQGQTVLGPAGDSGAADCDFNVTYATQGLAVDFPASSPFVTGVGGTEFNEAGGTYWSTTNGANGGTAISYIPEQPWNETYLVDNSGALFGLEEGGAGGGGVSSVFAKPSWQVGTGVPADASRDVPDLAFNAAANHDGYLVCVLGSCASGFGTTVQGVVYYDIFGGTSVSTPSFAGILALLEQKLGKGALGNVNPNLYGLANSNYYSSVFHDVTSGTNAVPCTVGSIDCASGYPNYNPADTILCPANSCSGDIAYSSIGYNAGVGYDLASGWGSVDVNNMVSDWLLATPTGVSTSTLDASTTTATTTTTSVSAGATVTVTASVASANSGVTTTPTGNVQLVVDNVAEGSPVALTSGAATLTFVTTNLASGQHTFSVSYSGDSIYAGSKGSVAVDIVSATGSDFTLTPATATATTTAGGTAAGITYTVTPVNGFTGNVSFTASTTSTSLNATYSFSVPVVDITSTAGGTTVFTLEAFESANAGLKGFLNKSRLAAISANKPPVPPATNPWILGGSGVTLAGLILFTLPRRRRNGWSALLIALISVGVLAASGCSQSGTSTGTNGNINATPGTYSITVTAQGANSAGTVLTHNAAVTFVVQ